MSTLPQRPSAQPGDGLGYRVLGFDKKTGDRLEMLRLRPQFSGHPDFEPLLQARVQQLADLRGPGFARVRQIDRLTGQASGVAIVSNHVEGIRLADLLQIADTQGLRADIDAALCLLRQLVSAITNLHAAGPDICHGCIGPERLIVTPDARLLVTEYVLSSALEAMNWTRERFWQEVRIALPAGPDPATFTQRADILQIGLVALALVSGRGIYAERHYPLPLAERLRQARETSATGASHPLGATLGSWLTRMLQLDPAQAFSSMDEAQAALDAVIADGYLAAPASVAAFVERCQQAAPPEATARDAADAADKAAGGGGDRPAAKARITQAFAQPFPAPAAPGTSTASGAASVPASASSGASKANGSNSAADGASPSNSASTPASAAVDTSSARIGATAGATTPGTGSRATKPAGSDGPSLAEPRPAAQESNADAARGGNGSRKGAGASSKPSLVIQPDAMVDDDTPITDDVVVASQPRVRKPYLITLGLSVLLAAGFHIVLRYANPFGGSPAQASAPVVLPSSMGTLTIDASPKPATVFIDDVARGTTPLRLDLAAGTHNVRLDDGEGLTRTFPVAVTAGKELSHLVELARSAETGALDVRSDPAGARVSLDGRLVGMSPVTVADVAPGDHTILVEGPQGTVRQTVKVIAGTRASMVVPLAAAAGSSAGWLQVTADQEVQVVENGQVLGSSRADRIMMPAGSHDLEFTNDAMGFHLPRKVQITAGKTTQLTIPLPDGAVSVNATPWAEVFLDGQRIGETPVGNFAAKPGSHELLFRHPKLGEKKQSIVVRPGQTSRVTQDMTK